MGFELVLKPTVSSLRFRQVQFLNVELGADRRHLPDFIEECL
jgi:hypothetical protein